MGGSRREGAGIYFNRDLLLNKVAKIKNSEKQKCVKYVIVSNYCTIFLLIKRLLYKNLFWIRIWIRFRNPDPKHLFWFRIRIRPKVTDPQPQHCFYYYLGLSTRVDEEREEEVEEEGLEGVEENLERGEDSYLKEERDYQMMAEGDKVPPDQENSKGKKNPLRFSRLQIRMAGHSVADPGCLSRILILPIPDPGCRIPDPNTFLCTHKFHKIEIYFSF